MKKPVITAFFLFLGILLTGCGSDSNPAESVTTDHPFGNNADNIQLVSTAYIFSDAPDKKDLTLIYFRSNDCNWGDSLEDKTFIDPTVVSAVNLNCDFALVNTSSDTLIGFYDSLMTGNELFKLYNLVGVPSFLLLDKECKYVGRIRGYKPAEEFLSELDYFINAVK